MTSPRKRVHAVIPDTQIRAGVPTDHLAWVSAELVETKPDVIVVLGDWFDMPSLSSHDAPGSLRMEGARYEDDIAAGNDALAAFMQPIHDERARLVRNKEKQWKPELHFLMGNHEQRIERAVNGNPKLAGTLGYHHLRIAQHGFKVHDFLHVVEIDGIWYSHYFYRPLSGRPYSGSLDTRLKNVGRSFTQGHEQVLDGALRHLANGDVQRGLVAGACYLHDETYKGPQGNQHWRGILIKYGVRNGRYSLREWALDDLCHKYEGVYLDEYLRAKYPDAESRFTLARAA